MIGHRLAAGPGPALTTCGHTLIVAAHIASAAVTIVLALVPTAAQRIAQISVQAGAGRYAIDNLTLGVDAARAGMALFLCESRIISIIIDSTSIANKYMYNNSGRHFCIQLRPK